MEISDEEIDVIFKEALLSLWQKNVLTVVFNDDKIGLAFNKDNAIIFEQVKENLTDYELMLVGTVMDINAGLV